MAKTVIIEVRMVGRFRGNFQLNILILNYYFLNCRMKNVKLFFGIIMQLTIPSVCILYYILFFLFLFFFKRFNNDYWFMFRNRFWSHSFFKFNTTVWLSHIPWWQRYSSILWWWQQIKSLSMSCEDEWWNATEIQLILCYNKSMLYKFNQIQYQW